MQAGFPLCLLVLMIQQNIALLPSFAQKNPELYVVERKPPSVRIVDSSTWEQTATIPLEGTPERAQFDAREEMLYILTREVLPPPAGFKRRTWQDFEEKSRVRVLVVDPRAREVIANVELGAGRTQMTRCRAAADHQHLVCWYDFYDYERQCERADQRDCMHGFSRLTILDHGQDHQATTIDLNFQISGDIVINPDATRIWVPGFTAAGDRSLRQYEHEPGSNSLKLLRQVSIKRISEVRLSADNQWLYVFSAGDDSEKTKENARLYVLDPETLKTITELPAGSMTPFRRHQLLMDADSGRVLLLAELTDKAGELLIFNGTTPPITLATGARPRFQRLGGENGIWITSKQELRFLPTGANDFTARILLAGPPPNKVDVGGYSGPMIYLPIQRKAAMIVTDDYNQAKAKVALIDVGQQTVQNVVTTGRRKAKVAKVFSEFAGAMIMGAIAGVMAPLDSDLGYYTPSRQAQLVAKPDGSVIYALNTSTSDLTAIDTNNGAVLGMFKVCSCGILSPTLNGRFILAHSTEDLYPYEGEDQVTWLDLSTNRTSPTVKFPKQRIKVVAGLAQTNITFALTTRSLALWNSDTGELLRRTGTFNDSLTILGTDIIRITEIPTPQYSGNPNFALEIGSGE